MKNKIPYFFFFIIYFNEGFFGLPDQAIYYLFREVWHYTASQIGLIGFITSLAWILKPAWGTMVDIGLGQYKAKNYLIVSMIGLLCSYLYIIVFGLNFISILILFSFINICVAISDVSNDNQMVKFENEQHLKGALQCIQWSGVGIASIIVSLLGAWIADNFNPIISYKICYAIIGIIPIIILIYLWKFYQEDKIQIRKKFKDLKSDFSCLKNKNIIYSLLFIACFQLCPSFGTGLMIQMREVLHIDKMFIGYLGAISSILGIIGYGLYYWKCKQLPMKFLLYFMIIFSALTNLCYLYIPNQWFILLYTCLFGIFGGITFITLLSFFATLVPKGAEGMIYALITSLSNFCVKGGGWLGGTIFDHYGYTWNVIIATILTLCCLIFIPHLRSNE